MKRIHEYKKLFGIQTEIDLKDLKKKYRNLVKQWHPDKFQDGDPLQQEAEMQSRKIIDGYHFLVSMAPEKLRRKTCQTIRKQLQIQQLQIINIKGYC